MIGANNLGANTAEEIAEGVETIEFSAPGREASLLRRTSNKKAETPPQRLMGSNFRDSYWTLAQLVVHHTVNGCNLQSGDLFGSGTQSGPDPGQGGSLLELTHGGKKPLDGAR